MKTSDIIRNRIGDARAAVLGFGVSNIPLVSLLTECGNEVTVYDRSDISALDPIARELEREGVRFVTGDGYLDSIEGDIIFRSPGIRPDLPAILDAVQRGAELTSEMELFLELTPATVIGITGSDGKTTTTTLTYKLLERAFEGSGRRVYVGGNIGKPLLSLLGDMTDRDVCVLELSSFQLFTADTSPDRAAITNVSPNHLDWHGDMNEYIEAKSNVFSHGAASLITNGACEVCLKLARSSGIATDLFSARASLAEMLASVPEVRSVMYLCDGAIYRYCDGNSERVLDISDILIPGLHNVENYMTAISLVWSEVGLEDIRELARSFGGVEHRLEFVRELDGVKYYNSSIDSSPSRTAAALSALDERPIVICGGYDKKIPFAPLAAALGERASAVILTGATAEAIRAELERVAPELPVHLEKDFERAVRLSREIAERGDTVLLSPACASFDAFKNFAERGNRFKCIVNEFR